MNSDFLIPIDNTGLESVIPSGEDILYSTLCKASSVVGTMKLNWTAHVLLTRKGVAYTFPRKRKPTLFNYVDWFSIGKIGKKNIKITGVFPSVNLTLVRIQDLESKQDFKERTNEFLIKFKLIHSVCKDFVKTEYQTRKERKTFLKSRQVVH